MNKFKEFLNNTRYQSRTFFIGNVYKQKLQGVSAKFYFTSFHEMRRLRRLIEKNGDEFRIFSLFLDDAKDAKIFYDVGANIGQYSIYARNSNPGMTAVYSFEPESLNFNRLKENILLNGLSHEVHPLKIGLGNQDGEQYFRIKGALAGEGTHFVSREPTSRKIVIRSIDSLLAEGKIKPADLVKIDVEGYEYQTLLGMKNFLQTYRPKIYLECHPRKLAKLGCSAEQTLDFIKKCGYSDIQFLNNLGGKKIGRDEDYYRCATQGR
ncbi:MAG: FkbM family methyltransferase [Nitrospinales bacterium]